MMKITAIKLLTLCMALFTFSACSDQDNDMTPGTVEVSVQNMVGTDALQLNNGSYTSPAGDQYTLSSLKYYLSNVKLIGKHGQSVYIEPESYHLIAQDGNLTFKLDEVPVGMYDQIELSIGVDEAHNHSTDQEGDLDPSNEMVWDWDTGYKFLSLVGTFTGDTKSGNLVFHVGGDTNYKKITLDLPKVIDLRAKSTYNLEMQADVNELFKDPHTVDFDVMNSGGHGTGTSMLAENYSDGFLKIAQVK